MADGRETLRSQKSRELLWLAIAAVIALAAVLFVGGMLRPNPGQPGGPLEEPRPEHIESTAATGLPTGPLTRSTPPAPGRPPEGGRASLAPLPQPDLNPPPEDSLPQPNP